MIARTFKRVLGFILCFAVVILNTPIMAYSADNTIYVSSKSGSDSNSGVYDAPVATIEKALELVEENGIIQIIDSTSTAQLNTDEPLCITKSITIMGGEITMNRAGIVLGADVTFQDVSLNIANPVRNAIIANGYSLTLENVKGTGTYSVHLFCGEVTGYTGSGTLPAAGESSIITISGSDNKLGNIYAGSLSEYNEENEWTGSSDIVMTSGAGGTLGAVYAHGATEPRGEGDGESMTPDSDKYIVTGEVRITLSGSKPAAVYGAAGGETNAAVIVNGGANLIDNIIFEDLASLSVTSGSLCPLSINEGVDLAVSAGAELDLSVAIADETSFSVKDFTGGGTLVMGTTDKLSITGSITGTTSFQTSDYRPADKSTSGIVEYSYAYIDVTNATGDGKFTFIPYDSQIGTTLEKLSDNDTIAWTTSVEQESTDIKPDSFDIPVGSYTVTTDGIIQEGLKVPVSCGLGEYDSISDVPLNITISKDGAEAVSANRIMDEYGGYYVVESLGFNEIYGTYGEGDTDWQLVFYVDSAAFGAGVYTISISVILSDDSEVTEAITLTVGDEAALAGYTLSLNGNIGVNFYMELSDRIANDAGAYMLFTLPDNSTKQVAVAGAVKNTTLEYGKTYYVFSCEVASYEMTQAIKAQLFDGNGNGGTEYSYTVRDYAEYIMDNADKYSEDDVAFVKAMLNYGACAQSYFDEAVTDLANKNLEAADQTVETLTADSLSAYKVSAVSNDLGAFSRYSLVLKSETTLKVYFKPDVNVSVENLTFSVNGTEVEPVLSGEYYVLAMENIKAWDLDNNYTFMVSDGSTELEFSCCALSYGYSLLSKEAGSYPDTLIQLISAMRVYQQRSEVYVSESN